MHKPTVLIAVLMVVLGLAAYFMTGMASVTAMIPTFIGVPILLCGLLASKARKPALIVALVLGVLAAAGPLGRIVPSMLGGELDVNAALVTQLLMIVLSLALIGVLIPALRSSKA